MANPSLGQPAIGVVDGVNVTFRTPAQYVPGTLQVWLNGQLKRRDLADGWIEAGGSTFQMKIAPVPGDDVQVYFVPL